MREKFARGSTYGEEWRERARKGHKLAMDERRMWLEEQEWEKRHPEEVADLERLVGGELLTIRELVCVDDLKIRASTRLTVRARFRDRLLVESSYGKLLVRVEWTKIESLAPSVKKDETPRPAEPFGDMESPAPWIRKAVKSFMGPAEKKESGE